MVADCLSFTQAAKRLFISQSAISSQIAALEQELGCKLFTRNHRVVRLTLAGEDFFKVAKALLADYENGVKRLAKFCDGKRETASIGIDFALIGQSATQLFRQLHERFTTVDFKTTEMQYHAMLSALNRHEIEIGFPLMTTGNFNDTCFRSIFIGYDSISLLLSSSHHLVKEGSPDDLSRLVGKCFGIAHQQTSEDYDTALIQFVKERGLRVETIKYVDTFSSLELMVAAGFGFSIVPTSMAKPRQKGIKSYKIQGSERLLRRYLIWNNVQQQPMIRAIAAAIAEFMKQRNAEEVSGLLR
jgi:DNA-binding transcriptional LysR family regulator